MSDVDWRKSGPEAIKDFQVDQEISAIIIDIDPSKERISLGIKQLDDDPMESLDQIKKGFCKKASLDAFFFNEKISKHRR